MTAIEIVSVPVTDQQASKNFYLKIGFQLIVEADMGNGSTWVQLGLPGRHPLHWSTGLKKCLQALCKDLF